jgi:hypothetical protein
MHRPKIAIAIIAGLAFMGILSAAVDNWQPVHAEEQDIVQKIANAKTAADHEAIADYFTEQASAARERAEAHRKMADAYKKMSNAAAQKWRLPAHCDGLVKMNESAARDYAALAEAHREMAKMAK